MKVDLFDFDLPEDRIALRPAEPRDTARLLAVRPGEGLEDLTVRDLPSLLRTGDVLVFNDTKVIPAQLRGFRRRGDNVAQVEATLHMRTAPDRWLAFMRPGKRVAAGDRIHFGHDGNSCFLGQLDATVLEKHDGGEALLGFDLSGTFLDEALHAVHVDALVGIEMGLHADAMHRNALVLQAPADIERDPAARVGAGDRLLEVVIVEHEPGLGIDPRRRAEGDLDMLRPDEDMDHLAVLQLLARRLPAGRNLTVVTHSLPAMSAVARREGVRLIGLAGSYEPELQVFAGPLALAPLTQLRVQTLFLAGDVISVLLPSGLILSFMALVLFVRLMLATRVRLE